MTKTSRFSDYFLEDADPRSLMNYVRKLKGNVEEQGNSYVDINIVDILPDVITNIINEGSTGDMTKAIYDTTSRNTDIFHEITRADVMARQRNWSL